jgi:hypothetical protein
MNSTMSRIELAELLGVADVAAARRDGLVGCHFQPIRFRRWLTLWIGWHRGCRRHTP